MQFGMIGSGSWATALAKILTDNGHTINWWVRNEDTIRYIQKRGHNPHYLGAAYFNQQQLNLDSDIRNIVASSDVLVIAMGEFGRTPMMGTQGSTDGRNHWNAVMSMAMAGGGLRHGQVIGATEADGGHIKDRPVTPGDLAATIYRHMGVPLDATYLDTTGRPRFIVEQGRPIAELF